MRTVVVLVLGLWSGGALVLTLALCRAAAAADRAAAAAWRRKHGSATPDETEAA